MKTLLYISIFTSIIVLSWLIFGIYHNQTTSTITSDTSIIITPIPPKFDTETIDRLRERKVIEANLSAVRIQAASSGTQNSSATTSASNVTNSIIDQQQTVAPTNTPTGLQNETPAPTIAPTGSLNL